MYAVQYLLLAHGAEEHKIRVNLFGQQARVVALGVLTVLQVVLEVQLDDLCVDLFNDDLDAVLVAYLIKDGRDRFGRLVEVGSEVEADEVRLHVVLLFYVVLVDVLGDELVGMLVDDVAQPYHERL